MTQLTAAGLALAVWALTATCLAGRSGDALTAPGGAGGGSAVQLPYATVPLADLRLPADLPLLADPPPRDLPGRRVPELVAFSALGAPNLAQHAVPLPEANTRAHLHYQAR